MFGTAVRAVGLFVSTMLMASVLAKALGFFVDPMKNELGQNAMLVQSFQEFEAQFALIGLVAAALLLIAAAIVESKLPGGF